MKYTVIYEDLEVTCDSFEALHYLAQKAKEKREQARSVKKPKVEQAAIEPNLFSNGNESDYESFISNLSDMPLRVIRELIAIPTVTDTEFRNRLDLSSNMQLAGFMSSITKTAKKYKLDSDRLIKKTTTNKTPGERAYEYSMPDDIKAELSKVL